MQGEIAPTRGEIEMNIRKLGNSERRVSSLRKQVRLCNSTKQYLGYFPLYSTFSYFEFKICLIHLIR